MLLAQMSQLSNMKPIKKFEVALAGMTFKTDPNIPNDYENLGKFIIDNKEHLKELIAAQPQATIPMVAPAHHPSKFSATFQSIIEKYKHRKQKELAEKSLYQYVRIFTKFMEWAEERDGYKPFLMTHIDKQFLSMYVDFLQANGYINSTIENNYLKPLNTFFDFASSIGEFPDIDPPSKGHRLRTSTEEKIKKVGREMFSIDELQLIFSEESYKHKEMQRPDLYWLPILAIFTGARMNELCKLAIFDIQPQGEFYTLSINEENGSLKNKASKRTIPLHKTLIDLGFINYLEDVRKFGSMVFPNLLPDTFGSYIKEPSKKFGEYLDSIGLTDESLVFHSFRGTSNNILKKNKVANEPRREMLGHEHEDTNERDYTEKYTPQYLFEEVLPFLIVDVDFSHLTYTPKKFNQYIIKRLEQIKNRKAIKK